MNLIGRQVSRLRYQRGWTQDMLADKLQLAGLMISRSGISKIESGLVYVHDFHLFYFAHVLDVGGTELFPRIDLKASIHETMLRFIRNENRGPLAELAGLDPFEPALLHTAENIIDGGPHGELNEN